MSEKPCETFPYPENFEECQLYSIRFIDISGNSYQMALVQNVFVKNANMIKCMASKMHDCFMIGTNTKKH